MRIARTEARFAALLALLALASFQPADAGPAAPAGAAEPTAPAPADPRTASTRRMAERLEAAARAFRNPRVGGRARYFSANTPWNIPRYRRQLERNPALDQALQIRFELARELLWDGRSSEARDELNALERALDERGGPSGQVTPQRVRRLLAISNLRIGEQANCLSQHTPESCVFPIEGRGRHEDPTGSLRAISLFGAELRRNPNALSARWLLNLAYMTVGQYPEGVPARWRIAPERFASEYEIGRFADVAIAAGADLDGLAGGGILEDFDGDGRLDVVASSWGIRDQLAFLRNRGDGRFEDRTQAAGLAGITGGLNANHADFDNDGHADVLVLRGGWLGARALFPNSLLRNLGDGRFEDVTEAAGLLDAQPGQTAAWADYDGDGWLDLFVGNETTSPSEPHPCALYHNRGDGTFADVANEVGLASLGFVKGATWGDYDNDGRPDLYVSRMDGPNLLFRNAGAGSEPGRPWRFAEQAAAAGVQEPERSFPTWFFDYDNDGWLDLFVAAWDGAGPGQVAAAQLGLSTTGEHPRLYRNRGDGTFADVTAEQGLDRVLLAMGANFGDLDNDGFLDVYVGTGAPDLATLMPNRMFRNAGGRRFQDVTTSGGFGHLQKGHGIAFGDVDGDGDQDVYSVLGGWYTGDVARNALLQNPGHGHHWITLRLRGTRSNRFGVGARIHVAVDTAGGRRHVHRSVGTGGSFGSSSLQQEIGLGDAQSIALLEVHWPASGVRQRFEGVALDRIYEVGEDAQALRAVEAP